jgi:hypothetical protein
MSIFHEIFSPSLSKPEVKSTELSFQLEYKINEETLVIEDIYVAKYNGITMDIGIGDPKFGK